MIDLLRNKIERASLRELAISFAIVASMCLMLKAGCTAAEESRKCVSSVHTLSWGIHHYNCTPGATVTKEGNVIMCNCPADKPTP